MIDNINPNNQQHFKHHDIVAWLTSKQNKVTRGIRVETEIAYQISDPFQLEY